VLAGVIRVARKKGVSIRMRGKRAEYRVRDILRDAGLFAERVPLSGSARAIKGDVVFYHPEEDVEYHLEVKKVARRRISGYGIRVLQAVWENPDDAVMVRVRGVGKKKARMRYIVLVLETFAKNLRAGKKPKVAREFSLRVLPTPLGQMQRQAEREDAFLVVSVDRKPPIVLIPFARWRSIWG